MSPGEVAAVVAAVAAGILVVGLLFMLGSVIRTMTAVRHAVEDLRRETIPLLADVHTAVREASGRLDQVETVLEHADSISGTVDSGTKLAYRVFATPVIKLLALANGGARAFRTLRERA
ncbi:MAG TPA: hypothetical protein VHG90_07225 [Acidimicrobiales bacterium]|nr:hypothetical protein [Acidimicrobiales bacterium]